MLSKQNSSKMKIIEEKQNPLLKRKEVKVIIKAEKNPSMQEAGKTVSEKFKVEEEKIVIKQIKSKFGRDTFLITANIYVNKEDKEEIESTGKKKKSAEKPAEQLTEEKPVAEEEVKEAEKEVAEEVAEAGEKVEKEVEEAEEKIAKEVTKVEDRVVAKKVSQTEADKEIREEVKEVVEEASKEVEEIKEKVEEEIQEEAKKAEEKIEKREEEKQEREEGK